MWDWLDQCKWYVWSILLAVLGGVVRGMSCPREKFTLWGFAQRVLAALLIGVIATLILSNIDLPETTKTAIAAAAGYSANDVLASMKPWIKRKLGL